jgi:hypothetical protein
LASGLEHTKNTMHRRGASVGLHQHLGSQLVGFYLPLASLAKRFALAVTAIGYQSRMLHPSKALTSERGLFSPVGP